ncbi:hypothetical protein GL218_08236 [Daldinia childiae]|uniref:uncharacterized protein n=1 Tax=Daldinia childiae TaxID=326645 RepID=UPI0014480366|nr:uncharacterized protein GL218_08236 [Daldinia childiae]KAF3069114.1 hypothetical protein GL218_08236 [Daldinia childiae]
MATTGEPTEESITLFCDITDLPRNEAITRLKANNNDLQRATEEYFEDPDSQKYKWDESQFSMDRHGEATGSGICAVFICLVASYQNNTAPTRPPSRANNTSSFGAPANAAEEDANLERALAESAAESGIQRQEAGIIDNETNLKYFGPANRPEYDTEQWAMVPTKTSIDAVKADPTPSHRKRDPEAPTFLRQTKDHRVGFILSIYHKIPAVRNILLQCGNPAKNYGHNSEWWKGQPILKHEHLAAMARGESIWGDEAHPEFSEELHRLMAFLDKTERSYGTVDGLIDTKAIDPSFGSWMPDVEDKLFEAIKEEAPSNPACDLEPMTTMGTVLSCAPVQSEELLPEGDADSWGDEEQDTPFIFLDLALDHEQYQWVNTFYDALDNLLWTHALALDHSFPEDSNYAVLSKPAEIMTIRLNGTGLVKPCEVPAVLYVDRYMRDRKDLGLKFQTYMRLAKKKLRLYDLLEASLVRCHGQHCQKVNGLGNGPHDLFACLNGIMKHSERMMQSQIRAAQWRYHYDRMEEGLGLGLGDLYDIHTWSGPYTFLPEEEERMKKWTSVVDECREKLEELKTDLANLVEAKKAYYDSMRVISKRLTCQEHEVDDEEYVFRSTTAYHPEYWNPTHKYTLRGVALTNELAYVCVRQGGDSMEVDGGPASLDQWWKIGYSSGETNPIKTEKAILEDVLHAAGTESKYPIFIYASEAAMEAKPLPLSDALRMFVRADNRSFQQELAQEQSPEQLQNPDLPGTGITAENLSYVPNIKTIKRKHSIGSSVATRGSSRDDLDDVDLIFDNPDQFPTYPALGNYYEPVASSSPQSKKLGGIVESLANCRTNENEPTGSGGWVTNEQEHFSEMQPSMEHSNMEEMQTFDSDTSKPPEMQERTGGPAPFLTRSSHETQSGPIDMMDIDLDVEHHE